MKKNYNRKIINRPKNKNPIKKINPKVKDQGKMVKQIKLIARKVGLVPAREIGTGVDFYLRIKNGKTFIKIPIDFKFSFGVDFETGHIKARVTGKDSRSRKLINNSTWIMVADEQQKIRFFKTDALRKYVSQFWGRIDKRNKLEKVNYTEYSININDLLKQTGEKSIISEFNESSINQALCLITKIHTPPSIKTPIPKMKSLIKNTKKINSELKEVIKPNIHRKGLRHK